MDRNKLSSVSDLRTASLEAFQAELVAEFSEKHAEELTVSSVTELTEISEAIQRVRAELAARDDRTPTAPSAEELAAAADAAAAAIELGDESEAAEADAPAEADAEELGANPFAKKEDAKDGGKDDDEEDANGKKKNPFAASVESEEVVELSPSGIEGTDLSAIAPAQAAIVAGADIPGRSAGTPLVDMHAVAEAFIDRRQSLRGTDRTGDGDDIIVASIRANYPSDRVLDGDAPANMEKINALASPEAIVASGGLCAPLEPYYGIQVISQASRPVRDSLPKFTAERGGVRFLPPPRLSDLTASIGVTTAEQDAGTYGAGGGETPFKPCLHVVCGQEQTAVIEAIHRCLTFGNFSARTYPEQVEAWLALAIASHARRAETLLLDAIDAASTATTGATTYSAVRTLLPQIDAAVDAYRSRNRTAPGLNLRVMLPEWTKGLIRADLARGYRGDLDALFVNDAQITEWFTARNVNVTFYIDSATGAGQIFGAQGVGALSAYPTSVVWYLYVEGSFVFLDGGVLDLGLVRDSTLNKTNDYQVFAESFEGLAFYGIESVKVTSTVCPNGAHAPAASALAPGC